MSPTLDDALEGYRTHCRVFLSRLMVVYRPQRRRRRRLDHHCHIVPSRPTATRHIHPRPARRAAKYCPGYRLRTEGEIPTLKESPQRTRMGPAAAAEAAALIVVVVVEPPPPPPPDERRGNEASDPVLPPAAAETNTIEKTTTARRRGTVYRNQNCTTCAIKKEG
jgi:hypothetical protein